MTTAGVAQVRCVATSYDPDGQRWSYTLQLTDPAPEKGPTYVAITSAEELPYTTGRVYQLEITGPVTS